MHSHSAESEFHVEKRRVEAVVTLAGGDSARGWFFISGTSALHEGAERVGDLLNSETGFFPFEIEGSGGRTVLYNRHHVIMVRLFENEARQDPGYAFARRLVVSILLSTGRRVEGAVRVYRPEGRDRLSDWTRQPEPFRYIESDEATVMVNASHIVTVSEVPGT